MVFLACSMTEHSTSRNEKKSLKCVPFFWKYIQQKKGPEHERTQPQPLAVTINSTIVSISDSICVFIFLSVSKVSRDRTHEGRSNPGSLSLWTHHHHLSDQRLQLDSNHFVITLRSECCPVPALDN